MIIVLLCVLHIFRVCARPELLLDAGDLRAQSLGEGVRELLAGLRGLCMNSSSIRN